MAYLSKIKLGSEVYDLKDTEARAGLDLKQNLITEDAKVASSLISSTLTMEGIDPTDLNTVEKSLVKLRDAINAGGTGSIVDVKKLATAETGYIATYQITQGGNPVGVNINIPKDFLVKSATLKEVTEADTPYAGAKVGDKYIDFVINSKDGTATEEHIYLPVNDLVDVYLADETTLALNSETNTFSIKAVPINLVTGLQDALNKKEDITNLKGFAYASSITVPSQEIKGVKATGDINVTVADGALVNTSTAAKVALTKESYTPAGTCSAPTITVTPTTDTFAKAGVVATVDGTDTEMLVLTNATTANAMTAASATSTAPEFTGTAKADALVTAVSATYDKASLDGSKITAATEGLTVGTITVASQTVNAPAK